MRSSLFALFVPFVLAASVPACGTSDDASFLVIVDTDLPTPEVASRLRVDAYTEAGVWFDSREVDTSRPESFPVSFGVAKRGPVRLRIRVFPAGHTREYRGERFQDWPDVLAKPAPEVPGNAPRLAVDGADRTPEVEPLPSVTVDRLVRVDTGQGVRAVVRLRGACAGMMANLQTLESCAETPRRREPLVTAPSDGGGAGIESQSKSMREPCAEADSTPARACVPGGAFVMGEAKNTLDYPGDSFLQLRAERIVRVHRFFVDRHEITVGRYRKAAAAGFKPARFSPAENDGPWVARPADRTACTYSAADMGRENYGLSCASWVTFREFCNYQKGELATEAQWEYVARQAGGDVERRFPWGDDEPVCEDVVLGRLKDGGCDAVKMSGDALAVVDGAGNPTHPSDATPLGVYDMVGGLSEYVLDNPAEYDEACFAGSPLDNVHCGDVYPLPSAGDSPDIRRVARGGSWTSPPLVSRSTARQKAPLAAPFYGARCVYSTKE
ncbi:MAG: formylglycine-generating enzyme family protein [Polyangiaceae bacterium]|nr:formylglycine-generating enzyme family protein [Polyangiaceae bacterium]